MQGTESHSLRRTDQGHADAALHAALETALRAQGSADLVRGAFEEVQRLARLEVALARDELRAEVTATMRGAAAIGAAAGLALSAFTMLMVTVAMAFSTAWLAALVIAGVLLVLSGALGLAGWKRVPKKPLGETRTRVEGDLTKLKERVVP